MNIVINDDPRILKKESNDGRFVCIGVLLSSANSAIVDKMSYEELFYSNNKAVLHTYVLIRKSNLKILESKNVFIEDFGTIRYIYEGENYDGIELCKLMPSDSSIILRKIFIVVVLIIICGGMYWIIPQYSQQDTPAPAPIKETTTHQTNTIKPNRIRVDTLEKKCIREGNRLDTTLKDTTEKRQLDGKFLKKEKKVVNTNVKGQNRKSIETKDEGRSKKIGKSNLKRNSNAKTGHENRQGKSENKQNNMKDVDKENTLRGDYYYHKWERSGRSNKDAKIKALYHYKAVTIKNVDVEKKMKELENQNGILTK